MRFFESESTIAARPDEVWRVLVDTASWPKWDSGVVEVQGTPKLGEKIVVKSAVAPDRAFPVKVTEFDAPRRMVLTGGMPLGLFRGVRTYTLTNAGGSTLFRMREEYSGPMVGLIWKSMPDLTLSFRQFALGLKKRVEFGA